MWFVFYRVACGKMIIANASIEHEELQAADNIPDVAAVVAGTQSAAQSAV